MQIIAILILQLRKPKPKWIRQFPKVINAISRRAEI